MIFLIAYVTRLFSIVSGLLLNYGCAGRKTPSFNQLPISLTSYQ